MHLEGGAMPKLGKIQSEILRGNLVFSTRYGTARYKGYTIIQGDLRCRKPFAVDGHHFSSLILAMRWIDKEVTNYGD